jgi:hypothetical protein
VKRLVLAVSLLAAFAVACGEDEKPPKEDEGAGGAGGAGGGGPVAPTFAGLEEVQNVSGGTARLFWQPAEDVETPAHELAYKIWVWTDNPAESDAEPRSYEWHQSVETDCVPRCRYNYPLSQGDVNWFAVEVTDADGMTAGRDVVLPGADTVAPTIDTIDPDTADIGSVVTIVGENFLDERTFADSLVLGDKAVSPEFVQRWDNRSIELFVPSGHGTGAVEVVVKTLGGTVSGTLTINE